jgi:hypothetical protein
LAGGREGPGLRWQPILAGRGGRWKARKKGLGLSGPLISSQFRQRGYSLARAVSVDRSGWVVEGAVTSLLLTAALCCVLPGLKSQTLAGRSYLQVRSSAVRTVGPIHQDTLASFKGLLECVEPLPLLPFSGGQSLPPVFQTPPRLSRPNADTHRCAPGRHPIHYGAKRQGKKKKEKRSEL